MSNRIGFDGFVLLPFPFVSFPLLYSTTPATLLYLLKSKFHKTDTDIDTQGVPPAVRPPTSQASNEIR